jgi:Fe(3+) dicitrate transport protein
LGLGAGITVFYTGKQFADEKNTVMASADGREGVIPVYSLMDGSLWYTVPKSYITLRLSVKNMTNNRCIAGRRPQGIRAGLPVWITGGIEFSF